MTFNHDKTNIVMILSDVSMSLAQIDSYKFTSEPYLHIFFFTSIHKKARSKLPKKRRRVLPVEQPRRKRGNEVVNAPPVRRLTLPKPHPGNALFKDAFGSAKIGKLKF